MRRSRRINKLRVNSAISRAAMRRWRLENVRIFAKSLNELIATSAAAAESFSQLSNRLRAVGIVRSVDA